MANLTFFDTETTWLDFEKDVIIQLAYINQIDWKIASKSVSYFSNWDTRISLRSKVAHWLLDEDLIWYDLFSENAKEFQFISKNIEQSIFIAHNAPFDVWMLKKYWLEITNFIDTYKVAKNVLYEIEDEFEWSYSEQVLKFYLMEKWYKFPNNTMAHDAMGDIQVLEVIFDFLYEKTKEKFSFINESDVLDKMKEFTINPLLLPILKFWKYKWIKFEDLLVQDKWYLEWLYKMNNEWKQDVDMKFTCEYYLFPKEEIIDKIVVYDENELELYRKATELKEFD